MIYNTSFFAARRGAGRNPPEGSARMTRTNSMLYKLLSSFSIIIALLIACLALAYTFFFTTLRGEITKNSSLNLNATVQNYEKHFELVRTLSLSLQFSDQVRLLAQDPSYMNAAGEIRNSLKETTANPFLYLNNIFVYFKNARLVVEKGSSGDARLLFDKLYASPAYPLSFWEKEMSRPTSFHIYASAPYYENSLGQPEARGDYMPILIKNLDSDQVGVIAFLDSARAYEDFRQPGQGIDFAILDADGQAMYASSPQAAALPPGVAAPAAASGYVQQDGAYYFYQTGDKTRFTYVSIVPYSHINKQMTRLNVILGALLALSVAISIGVSVWFSRKLNAPVRHLTEWLQSVHFSPLDSNIREFKLISDKISRIHQDIESKNSLLMLYAYSNKLKKIDMAADSFEPLPQPYLLLLFQLKFKRRFQDEFELEPSRAAYFIREYIASFFSSRFESTVTLQLERDQILTVLYFDESGPPSLDEPLGELAQVFNMDHEYCLVTIAVSPPYREAHDFNDAYGRVSAMIGQRRLGEQTQCVTELADAPPPLPFEATEEQELHLNLLEGNADIVVPLVQRALARLGRKESFASHYEQFAGDVVNRLMKVLYSHHIDVGRLTETLSPYEAVKDCYTSEAYERTLEALLRDGCRLIQEKKSETDHITSFVVDFIESHYAEDVSLDLLADRLGITRGYLSTYFKEKMGINFVDYVISYRMNKAKDILNHTDLKIHEVAALVGYPNVSTFIRVFKKQTGVTPGDYKKPKTG